MPVSKPPAPPARGVIAGLPPKTTPTAEPALPQLPKPRRRDGPLKIALEAPKRKADEDEEEMDRQQSDRPAKRVRVEGAGRSSLLSMLPAPSNKLALPPPKKGGAPITPTAPTKVASVHVEEVDDEEEVHKQETAVSFVPPTLKGKAKAKASTVDAAPTVDFFSISASISNLYNAFRQLIIYALRQVLHRFIQAPFLPHPRPFLRLQSESKLHQKSRNMSLPNQRLMIPTPAITRNRTANGSHMNRNTTIQLSSNGRSSKKQRRRPSLLPLVGSSTMLATCGT